jgi:Family of unknown function (DUF5946)
MAPDNVSVECAACGLRSGRVDGPTHRYIGSSAACWALYTELLAGPPSSETLANTWVSSAPAVQAWPMTPAGLGVLLVDAYAAQHHGEPSPQATQSVGVHLLVLHGVLRAGQPATAAQWIRQRALRRRGTFEWLTPPAERALSIRHLFAGAGVTRVHTPAAYVTSVFAAWERVHGQQLVTWYRELVLADR